MLTDINLTDIPDFVYQFEDAESVKGQATGICYYIAGCYMGQRSKQEGASGYSMIFLIWKRGWIGYAQIN